MLIEMEHKENHRLTYVLILKTWSTTDMAGGGPGLPRRPTTDARSALSPRSDMQVLLFAYPTHSALCTT